MFRSVIHLLIQKSLEEGSFSFQHWAGYYGYSDDEDIVFSLSNNVSLRGNTKIVCFSITNIMIEAYADWEELRMAHGR